MTLIELQLVVGMACATYLCRYPVLALVTRINLPPVVIDAMQFVPVAVLTAIIAPVVLAPAGVLALTYHNRYLVAAVATTMVAWRSRNLLLTIGVGMGVWWLWPWH